MSLTPRITTARKATTGNPPIGQSLGGPPIGTAAGLVIDGAAYPLEGEPPIAQTRGWGELGWLYLNSRRF